MKPQTNKPNAQTKSICSYSGDWLYECTCIECNLRSLKELSVDPERRKILLHGHNANQAKKE